MSESFLESVTTNDVDAVRRALDADPSLATRTDNHLGSTPLHYASHRGFGEIVHLLLERGADVHAVERASGTTPLHWAAEGGHESIARELVARGADLELRDSWFSLTPLGWATLVNWAPRFHDDKPACAGALRSRGAREDIFTAMHAGASQARDLVQFDHAALQQRLGFAARGMQPLHVAAREGWSDRAEVLLTAGAAVSETTDWGLTPMAVAVLDDHAVVAAILIDHGAREDASVALVREDYERLGREVETLSPELCTRLLFSAASYGRAEAIPLLVAAGADVNATTHFLAGELPANGRPLHIAAQRSRAAAVTELLRAGADVNGGAGAGSVTPLHLAAYEGDRETVETLLRAGADSSLREANFDGTPAQWAEHGSHPAIAALLRGSR